MNVLHARLTRPAARQVKKRHPWVFDQAITHLSKKGAPGDIAVLHDDKRKQIGIGLYDPNSPIRIRVLHAGGPAQIDEAFFEEKIRVACKKRAPLLLDDTTGYRVVHGENDGLGGLIVDRYADTLVVKVYSEAWLPHLAPITSSLRKELAPVRIVLRLARKIKDTLVEDLTKGAESKGPEIRDGCIYWGAPLVVGKEGETNVEFLERGMRFVADPLRGQKTGFFLDQRENRARVEACSDGARVLNVFSYSGGFSLFAARGGAVEVTSLDFSRPALLAADHHFTLNHDDKKVSACTHHTLQGDAFSEMKKIADDGKRFDVVIVDPPSFAKRAAEMEGALNSYGRLMRLALRLLVEGGLLVFASCSSRISVDDFQAHAEATAMEMGRPLQVQDVTEHALDHPIAFLEGAYLKCIYARA